MQVTPFLSSWLIQFAHFVLSLQIFFKVLSLYISHHQKFIFYQKKLVVTNVEKKLNLWLKEQ